MQLLREFNLTNLRPTRGMGTNQKHLIMHIKRLIPLAMAAAKNMDSMGRDKAAERASLDIHAANSYVLKLEKFYGKLS